MVKIVYIPKDKYKKIQDIISKTLKILNCDWEVFISKKLKDEDYYAELRFISDGERKAILRIGRRSLDRNWNEIEDTIIHEIIHIKVRPLLKNYDTIIENLIESLKSINTIEEERMVSDLTKTIKRRKKW